MCVIQASSSVCVASSSPYSVKGRNTVETNVSSMGDGGSVGEEDGAGLLHRNRQQFYRNMLVSHSAVSINGSPPLPLLGSGAGVAGDLSSRYTEQPIKRPQTLLWCPSGPLHVPWQRGVHCSHPTHSVRFQCEYHQEISPMYIFTSLPTLEMQGPLV